MTRVSPLGLRRRSFLQATGLAAGTAMLPSLLSSKAAAQAVPPKRLIIVFNELGWTNERLVLRRPDVPVAFDRDLDFRIDDLDESLFSPSLRPLFRHRADMLLIENMTVHTALTDRNGDDHARGFVGVTTGAEARIEHEVKSEASAPSIDQIIVSALRQQNPQLTDLASLHYGVHHGFNVWPNSFSNFHFGPFYRLDGSGSVVTVPHEGNPQSAFDRLFPTGGVEGEAPDPIALARPSVLDKVRLRTAALLPRLSATDRRKLQSHHDLIRDLENRLQNLRGCSAPPRMTRDGIANVDDTPEGRIFRYNRISDSFTDLIVSAFACDASRVATLHVTLPTPEQVGEVGDIHHDFSHVSEPGNRTPEGDNARDVMGRLTAVHATQLARLIDQLKSVPEAGGTMFDSTTILWINEISHGGHGHENQSAVLLGGAQGTFRTGRTVVYGNTHRRPAGEFGAGGATTGRPFNQLLTSVTRAMGVDVNSTGTTSVLSNAVGGGAVSIDLTGEAPLLR